MVLKIVDWLGKCQKWSVLEHTAVWELIQTYINDFLLKGIQSHLLNVSWEMKIGNKLINYRKSSSQVRKKIIIEKHPKKKIN